MVPIPKSKGSEPGKPFQKLEAANDNIPSDNQPIDAETLLGMQFSPVNYVVEGYVAEGLTILAGRPKLGKSWLALGFCVAVATGGEVLGAGCEQGDTLYLALEDNRRRLKDRLEVVLSPPSMRPNMSRLTLQTRSAKIGTGLIEELERWRTSVAEPRLIVIDTLSMVRPAKRNNQDAYAADYEAISPLQQYASEHRIALVVVHHVRKAEAEDPLEAVSGTNGLTGAADTTLVLTRTSDGPKLYGRGRDIEEIEKALRFEKGVWAVLGDSGEVRRSDQRRKIIAALQEADLPMKPAEIAAATGLKAENVRYLLGKMVEAGEMEKLAYGCYRLPRTE